MVASKSIHLLDPKYPEKRDSYCRWIRNAEVTTNENEVTCLHCIKKIRGIPHLS